MLFERLLINLLSRVVDVFSTESAEEIVQLFGNFHQLSEILKEKANAPGRFFFSLVTVITSILL